MSLLDTSTTFQPLLSYFASPAQAHRLLLCSGKYVYDIHKLVAANPKAMSTTLLVCLEELLPFPESHL